MVGEVNINLKKQNLMVFVVLAMFIVLVVPTFARFYHGNDSLISSEPYYHFRAAKELLKIEVYNPFSAPEDVPDMSYSPRDYYFNPYHYLLVYASRLVSISTASRIVPFLLGILSVFVFNLVLRRFMEEGYKRHIVLLLFVLNPAFIYTFTVSNPHAAAVFLSLLGTWLFMRDGKYNLVLSALCFVMLSLFSLFNTLLVISVLLAYVLSVREKQSRFVIIVLVLAIFSFAKRVSLFYNYAYSPNISVFSNLFSDLGSIIGFGIFSIVLAVYGVSSSWKRKSEFIWFFILSLLLIASVFFIGGVACIYLMFFVAVAAGFGFVKLYELQWSVSVLKNLALLILICGLLFSTASYMKRLASIPPDADTIESLDWLGSNTFKDGFVLSHYDYGYLISAVARNPVLSDSLAVSDYDQRFAYKVQDSMFYSRKLKDTKVLLENYDIKYVYITPEMKSGLVWSKPNEGLLFLFTNNRTFRNVYSRDGYDIWEVVNTTIE